MALSQKELTKVWGDAAKVSVEVVAERIAQHKKWGVQNHPDGTGSDTQKAAADRARMTCEHNNRTGQVTWADILREEFHEALAESDPVLLRAELIQVAAVAAAWVEAIDRRTDTK